VAAGAQGARKDGTVTLKTDRFLDVPEAVVAAAKKEGAAPFTVAKTAPAVDFAYHRDLGPDAAKRRLWSSWGDVCLASDGRVYVGIGDHGDDVGGDARCFLYRWDPPRKVLERVVDMNAVVPTQKGRARVVEGSREDRRGPRRRHSVQLHAQRRQPRRPTRVQVDGPPPGRAALPVRPEDRQKRRSSPTSRRSAARPPRSSTASGKSGVCNLEAGTGNALWGFDLRTKKPVFQADDGSMGFNRNFALARDGSVVFNGKDGALWKYDRRRRQSRRRRAPSKAPPPACGPRRASRKTVGSTAPLTARGNSFAMRRLLTSWRCSARRGCPATT
jgi:hypothetical protein